MPSFKLSVFVSLLAACNAAIITVTDVKIQTVYANGDPVSVATPSSSSAPEVIVVTPTESSSAPTVLTTTITGAPPVSSSASGTGQTTTVPATWFVGSPVFATHPASTQPDTIITTQAPTTLIAKTSTSSVASPSATAAGGADSSFASAILDAHNEKRAAHNVGALTWDKTLEEYAANYASGYSCSGSLTHSGGPYGENLAAGFSDGPAAVEAWYEEGANYDYSSASSFDHFTQVVWKGTTKLGCAYKDCSAENWGKYVICSYDPAGNVIGEGKENVLN